MHQVGYLPGISVLQLSGAQRIFDHPVFYTWLLEYIKQESYFSFAKYIVINK
jgi:hypothetical protein